MSSSFITFDLVGAAIDSAAAASARAARERAELDAARSRWRRVTARVRVHEQHCVSSGAAEFVVTAGADPGLDVRAIDAACAALEAELVAAVGKLAAWSQTRRRAEVDAELSVALADLAHREAAAVDSARREVSGAMSRESAPDRSGEVAKARSERVEQLLAGLLEPDSALLAAGAEILRTTDPARARLLTSDLSRRVRTANLATEAARAHRTAIAELRSDTADLRVPGPITDLLDRAETAPDPSTAAALLDQATTLADRARAAERPEPETAFVLDAVTAALTDLGYTVDPVTVVTPGSVLVNRPGAAQHSVLAQVVDNEISLRTVRTSPDTRPDDDRTQDRALCEDIDQIAAALRTRGVTPGRIRRAPAGIAALPLFERAVSTAPTAARTAKRRSTTTERSAP
ncbi:hypothetical protein [Nocardia sp. NPDC060249]|uniref:hypothetical protein n=1 Tax=Nocardia sp. NPDC060249 TaxID=3347082 RepID=UPI003654B752